MRRAVRALSVLVGLAAAAGGCKRATLAGGPDAGSGGLDDGASDSVSLPVPGDARTADGASTDGITITPVPLGTCPGVPPQACPGDRPAAGGACTVAGTVCEYGGADLGCRDRLICAPDLTWQPQTTACAAEVAGRCPAATPDNGSACDVPVLICSYPGQILCVCSTQAPSYWSCTSVAVDPNCPGELPLYGSACDHMGHLCVYGGGCGSREAFCCKGSWMTGPSPCSE